MLNSPSANFVGKLRNRSSRPTNLLTQKKFGNSPIQVAIKIDEPIVDDDDTPQGEDCLTLNIFTHGDGKNKPVMVWIYGGSFMHGGSFEPLYNGNNLAAANDVIVVSFNYRLNIFGFMHFELIDPSLTNAGYLGMIDQIAALKWVKENISAFGGNPDNITIFGESAGSISCMLLTVAPTAKGLFGKAIPQSANSYMYNTPEYSAEVAATYMELGNAKTMRDRMKKSADELRSLYEKVRAARVTKGVKDYLPTADGKFLPKNPFQALKDSGARGIKMLTGTTADEWRYWLFYFDNFFELFRDNPKNFSPVLQKYNARAPQEIYKSWLNGRPDTDENYMAYLNQIDWRVGQELDAENQSKFNDVYYYLFSDNSLREDLGSFHSLELAFVFNKPFDELLPNPNPKLVQQIQASWAAFAATGNPNNEFIPHWEKYSAANRQTMELSSKGCVCHKDLNTQNLTALRYVYED